MIQVGAADLEANSIVKDFAELHERLSYHIGAIISIERDRDREKRSGDGVRQLPDGYLYDHDARPVAKRTVTSGRLERVKLTEGTPGKLDFGYCFEGDSALREDLSLEIVRVKVLLDGVWKTVHEPEAWRKAEQEESAAAELRRLAITPLSQWTEEERSRHGQPSALGVSLVNEPERYDPERYDVEY